MLEYCLEVACWTVEPSSRPDGLTLTAGWMRYRTERSSCQDNNDNPPAERRTFAPFRYCDLPASYEKYLAAFKSINSILAAFKLEWSRMKRQRSVKVCSIVSSRSRALAGRTEARKNDLGRAKIYRLWRKTRNSLLKEKTPHLAFA